MKIDIIKAETDLGVHVNGTNKGPSRLTEYLKSKTEINEIYTIEKIDCIKNEDENNNKKNIEQINKFNETLYNKILEIKNKGNLPLTIGGDHSLAIATALASIKKEDSLGVIWIDSHADFNNFDSTITGNIHGVPFSTITDNNGREVSYFHDGNYYDTRNSAAIGTRDYYPEILEKEMFEKSGVTIFSTEDLYNKDIEAIVKEVIEVATKNTNGVHISFDIDIMDYSSAPGISIPAENGIDDIMAFKILNEVLKYKDKIKSFDLVEFNPDKDIDDITYNIMTRFLDKIIEVLSV